MKLTWKVSLSICVCLLVAGIFIGRASKNCPDVIDTVIIYEDSARIDSLERLIDNRTDVIDSLHTTIIEKENSITKIKDSYEKVIDSLDYATDAELERFFTEHYQ